MDRLIALVAVRWRLDVRAVTGERVRLLALLVAVPGLILLSAAASFVVFAGVRFSRAREPELTLSVLSAGTTALGLLWALSPLLAGMALTETHDLNSTASCIFPSPFALSSSLPFSPTCCNRRCWRWCPRSSSSGSPSPAQVAPWFPSSSGSAWHSPSSSPPASSWAWLLHALSRHRRLHDRLLFVGRRSRTSPELSATPADERCRGSHRAPRSRAPRAGRLRPVSLRVGHPRGGPCGPRRGRCLLWFCRCGSPGSGGRCSHCPRPSSSACTAGSWTSARAYARALSGAPGCF